MSKKQCVYMMIAGVIIFNLSRYGMDGLWRMVGLAVAICGLGVLVFIHELGHFLGGKLGRMAIESFQVGFGQTIASRMWGETEWKLCMIPFGGAVKFVSENAEGAAGADFSNEPGRASLMDKSRWFSNRPWPLQMITLVAGPAFSIGFAFPLLLVCFTVFGTPDTSVPPVVREVVVEAPAAKAGIAENDLLVSIGGTKVETAQQALEQLGGVNGETIIVVSRGTKLQEFKVAPTVFGKRRLFGIALDTPPKQVGVTEAASSAFVNTGRMTAEQTQGVIALLTGQVSLKHVSGPVGIINVTGKVAQSGPQRLLLLLAVITIGLGLTNLLPIPIMDGGRMIILLLRQFIGNRVADYYEPVAYGIGFVMVLVIFVAVTVKDFLTL